MVAPFIVLLKLFVHLSVFVRGIRIALGLCLALLVLVACGQGEVSDLDEVVVGGQTEVSESSPPPVPLTLEQPAEASPDATFSLASFRDGLEGIGAFQQETLLEFEGLGPDGQFENWRVSVTELVTTEPQAASVNVTTEGFDSTGLPVAMKIVRTADVGYLFMAGSGCVSGSDIGTDDTVAFRPMDIVGEVSGAQLVESDQLTGEVTSYRYQFSEKEIPAFRELPVSIAGNIYVASEGGYVTRLELSAEGPLDFLGDSLIREGVYGLEVDVKKIEGAIAIEPPVECTQELPYPLPLGALEITSLDDLLSFKTPMPIADVVDFFQSELPATGWSESAEPAIFEDLAILVFQRGEEEVTVQISSEPGDQLVSVFISP